MNYLKNIRLLIKKIVEEVDRDLQRSAGFIGGANVGKTLYGDSGYLGDGKTEEESEQELTVGDNEHDKITTNGAERRSR